MTCEPSPLSRLLSVLFSSLANRRTHFLHQFLAAGMSDLIETVMKKSTVVLFAGIILWVTGCQPAPPPSTTDTHRGNPDTPAGKAGKIAYKVEKETEKAAREAARKIDQAARDARAGYKDAKKKSDQ
jgi:hypothetical protein